MGKTDIKVTIIMPSLNVAGYIKESIDSARKQTLKAIEILCIDAGSTDGTWEIIQEEAEEDSRITVYKSPIKSYGYQVNLGIAMATGEYIAILETDDYVAEDMYEVLYNAAAGHQLDFVKCDYQTYVTDENGKRFFTNRKLSLNEAFYNDVFIPRKYPQTAIEDWYLWNGIYKKDFLDINNIRFSETSGAAFQDIGFLHKTCAMANKVIYLRNQLYRYCVDRDGASSNSGRSLKYIRKEYGLLLDAEKEVSEYDIKVLLYRRMARSFVHACMDSNDSVLRTEEAVNTCIWFQARLREAERWGCLKIEDIPDSLHQGYIHLMNPAQGFIVYRRMRYKNLMDFVSSGKAIIIFGCGVYGRKAFKLLESVGHKASYYMDNNEKLWDTSLDGVKVLSPKVIEEKRDSFRYLVANERYAKEIQAQLEKYVSSDDIFVYSSEFLEIES